MPLVALTALALMSYPPVEEPFFPGLGSHTWTVATTNPKAQRYFDEGMAFMNGFNHHEAIRSFEAAAKVDPKLAIAYWGIAIANGPNINESMVKERAAAAWQAVRKAQAIGTTDPVSTELIAAAAARYPTPDLANREKANKAYASAMQQVWSHFPNNPDVGALYAESLMDLHPWDYWTAKGEPKKDSLEILDTIRKVLSIDPRHPQGIHLYIHATEASKNPDDALPGAIALEGLQPGLGHMVHMPSHTYVRTGLWHEAIRSNADAAKADVAYRRSAPVSSRYLGYMGHNHDMLKFAAMMCGQNAVALHHAREAVEVFRHIPELKNSYLMAGSMEVMKRFGNWDAVLRVPEYPRTNKAANSIRHATRAVAYAATGRLREAREEQKRFEALAPAAARIGSSEDKRILATERHLVAGEIAYAEGRTALAISELRKGVQSEDGFPYSEPPYWMVPVRHALGAVLLADGRAREAVEVYDEDLRRWPNNGWSLYGRSKAYAKLGRTADADEDRRAFEAIWKGADTKIATSCLCVTK